MKIIMKYVNRILVGLGCLILTISCENKVQFVPKRPPAPVTIAKAVVEDVPLYLDQIGKCVAYETVTIQPQVSGQIKEVHFKDGVDVKVNDELFTIDPEPFQAQLRMVEADLAKSRANLDIAKIEWSRNQRLFATNAGSKEDYDIKKNAVDVANAQIMQSEAAIKTAQINLKYCFIHSPIHGRAGYRLVDPGNIVAANSTVLLTIQRLDPIYADFTITENDLLAVQTNMSKKKLKVEVRLPGESDKPRSGVLTFIDNTVQDATGTVKLRATLSNKDHHLWPGRFVKIRLILDTIHGAVLVPSVAPQVSAKGNFVYVVKENSTAEMRQVTLGQQQKDLIVIKDGLKGGEKVVIFGQVGVTPGGKVKIVEKSEDSLVNNSGNKK